MTQKEGQYAVYLTRERSDGESYPQAHQGYAIDRKDVEFIERYLKRRGFTVKSIKGKKAPPRMKFRDAFYKINGYYPGDFKRSF